MPYIKYFTFKTGINPSTYSRLDPKFLTGTQKVFLASSRIFGTNIGGNLISGNKILRSPLRGRKRMAHLQIPVWNHLQWFPWAQDYEKIDFRKEVFEERKLRILMRGVKVGRKKGGTGFSLMNIFEKKSEKAKEASAEKKAGGDAKKEEKAAKPQADEKK